MEFSCPFEDNSCVSGVLYVVVDSRKTLGYLSVDVWGCVSALLIVLHEVFSTAYRLLDRPDLGIKMSFWESS